MNLWSACDLSPLFLCFFALYFSMPRNPIITKLFRMVKLAENAGFGFDKIEINWLKYNNTKPIYELDFDSTILNLQFNVTDKVVDKVVDSLTQNQEDIIKRIKLNQYISARELSIEVGISHRKIQENIAKLKKLGIVKRIGNPKSGH